MDVGTRRPTNLGPRYLVIDYTAGLHLEPDGQNTAASCRSTNACALLNMHVRFEAKNSDQMEEDL